MVLDAGCRQTAPKTPTAFFFGLTIDPFSLKPVFLVYFFHHLLQQMLKVKHGYRLAGVPRFRALA